MIEILAGFVIGFFGSFHCVGMCGPIVIALPVPQVSPFLQTVSRVLYNIGRAITYSFMGLMFGFLGNRLNLADFQSGMSIAFGVLILFYIVLPRKYKAKIYASSISVKLNSLVKSALKNFIGKNSVGAYFVIGLLNGLLPCGFVYTALAGAITLGDPVKSMLFMLLFGLGTFPVMFITSVLGQKINFNLRTKVNKLIPYLAAFLAVLFILRGLNLGIPYISPKLNPIEAEQYCH